MISLTRLTGKEIVVNLDQVLFVESTPATCTALTGGERLMVREAVDEVVRRAEAFRRRTLPVVVRGSTAEEGQSWTSQP